MQLIQLSSLCRHPGFTGGPSRGSLLPAVAHQVGLEAWRRRQERGAVAGLALTHGVSRETVYSLGREVEQSWSRFEQSGGRQSPAHMVVVDRARLARATLSTRTETNASLRDIMQLHAAFYGLSTSFGWVQGLVSEAEGAARWLLDTVKLDAVEWMTLDEVYIHGRPILVGLDMDSGYLLCLKAAEDRSAKSWSQVLESGKKRGLCPTGMVSDAAKGLTSGARAAFPELKLRGDMFHGKREVGRLLRYLEKRGYDALKSAERRAHERDNPGRNDDAYELGQRCRRAGERADLAMHHHDQTLIIGREFFELIEAVDLMSGELRDAEAAIERITILGERLTWLSHEKCKKVGRFIKNQAKALCAWISQFTLALSNIGQSPEEDRAVRVLAHIWRLDQACARPQNAYRLRQLEGLRKRAVDQLAELDLEEGVLEALLQKTADVIAHRRRASSLVEAFNSVLRPWVEAHRRVTQGALDLFAAWWNFRTRKLGQRAPHCAYTALSGVLVPDWLSMLGFPPSGAWS